MAHEVRGPLAREPEVAEPEVRGPHVREPQPRQPASVWARELPGALALAAGQPLLLAAGSVLIASRHEDYDPAAGGAFGILLLLVLGPVLLPLLGLVHAVLFALPVAAAARSLGRRTGLPAAGPAVLLGAALAALYAAWGRSRGLPFGPAWAWTAGLAVLPVAGALYARARDARPLEMLARAAAVTGAGLLVMLLVGVGLAVGG
ncbi:hypothetical protein AB0D45_16585 [Streptomyces sp. NPDC048352]|uniref:hypothetical protein n=1 Tax=Streptomyces sp. NPDC048352 TaxID=3154718 RepID=UPI003439F579